MSLYSTYLILARGPVVKGVLPYHTHQTVSKDMVDMTEKNQYYTKNDTHHNDTSGDTIYENCYQTKGCFGHPDGCIPHKAAISNIEILETNNISA